MKRSFGAKTILLPAPVMVVGTYNAAGRPNLMTASWGGICSSDPPSVAVSVRPGRHTHANIVETGAFTVNIPAVRHARQADMAGLLSGKDADKFAAAGLTPLRGEHVNAPYVDEFPLALECLVRHTHALGVHTQFVGEILEVHADESVLDAAGNIDPVKLAPLCFSPADGSYYALGEFVGKAFSIGRAE